MTERKVRGKLPVGGGGQLQLSGEGVQLRGRRWMNNRRSHQTMISRITRTPPPALPFLKEDESLAELSLLPALINCSLLLFPVPLSFVPFSPSAVGRSVANRRPLAAAVLSPFPISDEGKWLKNLVNVLANLITEMTVSPFSHPRTDLSFSLPNEFSQLFLSD